MTRWIFKIYKPNCRMSWQLGQAWSKHNRLLLTFTLFYQLSQNNCLLKFKHFLRFHNVTLNLFPLSLKLRICQYTRLEMWDVSYAGTCYSKTQDFFSSPHLQCSVSPIKFEVLLCFLAVPISYFCCWTWSVTVPWIPCNRYQWSSHKRFDIISTGMIFI